MRKYQIIFSLFLYLVTGKLSALTCQNVKQLVASYLKVHLSVHHATDQVNKQTLNNLIKYWDPGKIYFHEEDVSSLKNKFPKLVSNLQSGTCAPKGIPFASSHSHGQK